MNPRTICSARLYELPHNFNDFTTARAAMTLVRRELQFVKMKENLGIYWRKIRNMRGSRRQKMASDAAFWLNQ